jgi:hypothetical protein
MTIKVTGKNQAEVLKKLTTMKLSGKSFDFKRDKKGNWSTIVNK